MQKVSQFYVRYQNIVHFDRNLWKLDYFEKCILVLMADPVDLAAWLEYSSIADK